MDAGSNDAPYLPFYDFEGDDRILDGDGDGDTIVDMGVDEAFWYPPVYLPVMLRDYEQKQEELAYPPAANRPASPGPTAALTALYWQRGDADRFPPRTGLR